MIEDQEEPEGVEVLYLSTVKYSRETALSFAEMERETHPYISKDRLAEWWETMSDECRAGFFVLAWASDETLYDAQPECWVRTSSFWTLYKYVVDNDPDAKQFMSSKIN